VTNEKWQENEENRISDTSVGSCVNLLIEQNEKMLILKRFGTKNDFVCDDDN